MTRSSKVEHAHPATEGHVIHWAKQYDTVMALFTLGREAAFRRRIVEAAAIGPGDRVLDVGCGTGTLALAAAERVGSAGSVVGIDPSEEMIAVAREKAARRGAGEALRFEVRAIERLPFADGSFDVVLSSLMFHHLPRDVQDAGLREIRRVLASGGRFVVIDFAGGGPWLHRFIGRFVHRHEDLAMHQGHSLERVAEQARALGFEGVEVAGFRPRFLSRLTGRVAVTGKA